VLTARAAAERVTTWGENVIAPLSATNSRPSGRERRKASVASSIASSSAVSAATSSPSSRSSTTR
jgi:hypothetical protein